MALRSRGRDEHHFDVNIAAGRESKHHHEVPIIRRRYKNENRKPMRYVDLHGHTTFSYKDGIMLPDAHLRRAAELKQTARAFTEHGNVASHVKAQKAAEKMGGAVKCIYGCEIYTGKVGEGATQRKYHLTLIAYNQDGYRNLLKLVSLSYSEGFHYEPTVSWEMLKKYKKGLFILSGCQGSLLFCSAVGGKLIDRANASYKRALGVARTFQREFGRFYLIEVQAFPGLALTCEANPILARIAEKLKIKLVASKDVHYTYLDEQELQMILHNIRGMNKKTIEEQAREWGYSTPLCPPPNDLSMIRLLKGTGLTEKQAIQAVVATEDIAEECNVTLPRLEMVRFPVPVGYKDARAYWDYQLRKGWRDRGFDKLPKAEREKRKKQLLYEKQIFEDKDFIDYMLIVQDAITFMKDQDIPVWLRGSAAGSIVCYLLRISDLDPVKYPMLVFERFVDQSREDLPDIDADFPSEARVILRDYLVTKYGSDCVANLGTFQYFKPKLALIDVARVFHVPKGKVETVKSMLIERSSGDLRASSGIEDTIEQFPVVKKVFEEHPELYKSRELEGNVKTHGVHAAGLVISNDDFRKVCSVLVREMPKGSGNWVEVLGVDKYDAEYLGMVKMDFLGLATMSLIWRCMKYLNVGFQELLDLVPYDDEEVYDAFRANDVVGIFQFDGRACRYVSGAVQPDNFEEVCDITALARPGALHNGAARDYAEIKFGRKKLPNLHPAVANILAPTKGQIVYQEQILRIVTDVGAFPYTKSAEIRRIIAKKHGEQAFNRQKELFMSGVATVHKRFDGMPKMSKREGEELWGHMITAGSYGFNAAHAYCYGRLGVVSMWIKVHHSGIFYPAALATLEKKTHDLLRDAARKNIRVLPPHPQRSDVSWQPTPRTIAAARARVHGERLTPKQRRCKPTVLGGFSQIDGIGEKTAKQIVSFREGTSLDIPKVIRVSGTKDKPKVVQPKLETWKDLIQIRGIGFKTIEKIENWVGLEDPYGAFKLDDNIKKVKACIESGELQLPMPTHTAHELPYESTKSIQVVWLGTILQRNIRDIFEMNRARKGEELNIADVKDPDKNEWAALTCEDETDQILLRIDRWKYPKFRDHIFTARMNHDLILVKGYRPKNVSSRQIYVKHMWVIDPTDDDEVLEDEYDDEIEELEPIAA
jgi:DNA polymerase-3 subunit alpha